MEKKLSIRELLEYYVERYEMKTDGYSSSSQYNNDGLGAFYKAITRIIKRTQVGDITLWDAMKPVGGARHISVQNFERLCFKEWAQYIEEYCSNYNKGALLADIEKNCWISRPEEMILAQNKALEEGYYNPPMEDDGQPVVSDEELKQKGHAMMIEAIYDLFYGSFNWDKLLQDMENSDISPDMPYNANLPIENLKAYTRLKSFLNYIGPRKSNNR